jgi:hypothetical protein
MPIIRNLTAALIAPAMKATGFRFSKDYRHGVSCFHRIVYRLVNTVAANHRAGIVLQPFPEVR